jgi:hypothetical protein
MEELRYSFADPRIYPDSTIRNFRCTNGEIGIVSLSLWVQDLAGNVSFCETFINLLDPNMDFCPMNSGEDAVLAGAIATAQNERIEGVEVTLSGDAENTYITGKDGVYAIVEQVRLDGDYSILPQKDSDPLEGVSTYDLVLMSKHILGQQLLDSPYRMIAADVNRSGSITTFDVVLLRKIILGVEEAFPQGDSWRFVTKNYAFRDPSNPFDEDFSEIINLNDLASQQLDLDFVAIKLGDVNGSYSSANSVESRTLPTVDFDVNVIPLEDDLYQLTFQTNHAQLAGYQFTLGYKENDLQIESWSSGTVQAGELAFPKNGAITCSWYGETTSKEAFSLIVRKKSDTNWADVLKINSTITTAEAYLKNGNLVRPLLNLTPKIDAPTIQLYPNTPNPFKEETLIAFSLPTAQMASLLLRDVHGKTVFEYDEAFEAGRNEVLLERKNLAAGIYYLTLVVGEQRLSQKILIQ